VAVSARVGNEEMLTFLVAATMDGSEQLKLVTIGNLKIQGVSKAPNQYQ